MTIIKAKELRKLYNNKILDDAIEIKSNELFTIAKTKINEYFNLIKNYDGKTKVEDSIYFVFRKDINDIKFNYKDVLNKTKIKIEKLGYKFTYVTLLNEYIISIKF